MSKIGDVLTPEEKELAAQFKRKPSERKKYMRALGSLGGAADSEEQQEYREKKLPELARKLGKKNRKYKKCTQSKDARRIHAWSPKGPCWYCGKTRQEVEL